MKIQLFSTRLKSQPEGFQYKNYNIEIEHFKLLKLFTCT